jgi:hypothetical protein
MTYNHFIQNTRNYVQTIEDENKHKLSHLMRLFHWSHARWRQEQRNQLVSQITLLPLEYGVLTNVVNLDKFNLFLLGLSFCGTKVICYLLLGLLQIHDITSSLASALISGLLKSRRRRIKKPPDKSIIHDTALIACSSVTSNTRHFLDTFEESFDHEETALVGLDSLCSRHLFNSKSDFVSKIEPIKPFSIHGVGGNIKAIGVGCVRIRF